MKNIHGWLVFCTLLSVAWWQIGIRAATAGPGDKPKYRKIEVIVRAYCPCRRCCGDHADGKYATGRRIRSTDYAFAVSRDLELHLPLDEARIFIEGYNKPGTMSVARDRTHRKRRRQIEVLMTVAKHDKRGRWRTPHQRAMDWGHRTLVLRVRERDSGGAHGTK